MRLLLNLYWGNDARFFQNKPGFCSHPCFFYRQWQSRRRKRKLAWAPRHRRKSVRPPCRRAKWRPLPPRAKAFARTTVSQTSCLNSYVCAFVDNTSGNDYFIPQGLSDEFSGFLQNSPSGITLGNCVLPTTYTATSTIPNASFAISAEGGAITPVNATDVAPQPGIAVPTNQAVMSGIMRVPATTMVSEISQANPAPIQFFYTRQDCAIDPYLSTPLCNTWTVKEYKRLFSRPPQPRRSETTAHGPHLSPRPISSVPALSAPELPLPSTAYRVETAGMYNNDYRPPVLQSCTVGGTTYADGQT